MATRRHTPQHMRPPPQHSQPRAGRRWPRRLLIGANVFVAFCLIATAGLYGWIRLKLDNLERIEGLCDVLRNCGDDDPGEPMNVLVVGSDTRENIGEDEAEQFGDTGIVGGQRSDTIMIMRVTPADQKAAILSIPRDLYVPIAGTTGSNRINTAFDGGARQLIATISASLDIHIDHYVEVDFVGFRSIVNAVGGVRMPFPAPARDKVAGLNVAQAGCAKLDGDQALAFARSRHFETFETGRWRTDPRGDLGRIERQQDFVRRMMRAAIASGIRNPVRLNALVNAGIQNVRIDEALSTRDILRMGRRFGSLEPDAVDMLTIPSVDARIGGAAVLRMKQPEAQLIIDRFNGIGEEDDTGPPPDILPATVRVRVLNGSGVGGQAGRVAVQLQNQGFSSAGTGDADSFGYATPVIRYGRGQQDKARLLRAYIDGPAQLREDLSLRGVDVVLTTGSGLGAIRAPGTAPEPTTATTVRAESTDAEPKGAVGRLDC